MSVRDSGVVGLACARALLHAGKEVVIVEKERSFGSATSSRSSEVIHAGLYYTPGSLMAQLCVQGKEMLYAYCRQNSIPHRRLGKLVVATCDEQIQKLNDIQATGLANGVRDLRLLSAEEAMHMEPALSCKAALLSPSTGIVDSHALMCNMVHDIESSGGCMAMGTKVVAVTQALIRGRTSSCVSRKQESIERSEDRTRGAEERRFSVVLSEEASKGGESSSNSSFGNVTVVAADFVVNSAGLHSQEVAQIIQGMPQDKIPQRYLAKGNYFSLRTSFFSTSSIFNRDQPTTSSEANHSTLDRRDGTSIKVVASASTHKDQQEHEAAMMAREVPSDATSNKNHERERASTEWRRLFAGGAAPFQRLIYPVPEPGGLGVHYTLDLAGHAKFGPDVEWIEDLEYSVIASRGDRFYSLIRKYYPGLPEGALIPSYSGIRPKITGPAEKDADFLIQDSSAPGHGVEGLINLFGIGSPGLTSSLAIAEHVKEKLLVHEK
ncbi:hypothetical protein CEUSTIGMA_g11081.t1 [Chlamydomonas eustigma]|uniref:L-2-hydroxyglutarate dehydrogenase, mitochondrial n=1 Tax=Chlamydomonas eustigma TaxID=1157962 RepID=A0A250XKV5_9CHLO|nr:hypothetical protein CEUSTIGMA_g11081.t1 [Chlamydomonas eustigma]|eukprot:GAX83656.1 hypothetical protein CEUSTIGMA_g11081.t1 [Chlamydomonas eustigma]